MSRDAAIKIEPRKLLENLKRDEESHKGENGKVAVIGGSKDFTGAPALAALGALRTGSDLVKLMTSEKISSIVAGYSENLIVGSYKGGYLSTESVSDAVALLEWADVGVIGPGLAKPRDSAVREITAQSDTSLVIDADAIEASVDEAENSIFTPHKKEVEKIESGYGTVDSFVEETGNVVILKGKKDLIFDRGAVYKNFSGTSSMTVGGTGDVLAGVVASLISQGLDPSEASRLGVYLNGKAGEIAAEEYGAGMMATDLVEEIPSAISKIR